MCVYLGTKFQVSSIILTSFRLGESQPRLELTANSTDRKSSIMDLKFNDQRELYTRDLKIYSRLANLKNIDEFGF